MNAAAASDIVTSIRGRLVRFSGRYPEIAARTGLSYSWISKFARGDRGKRPSFDLIHRLQGALDEIEADPPAPQPEQAQS
jgi:transcriptional regulator with XRE-family HTH domain